MHIYLILGARVSQLTTVSALWSGYFTPKKMKEDSVNRCSFLCVLKLILQNSVLASLSFSV